MLWLNQRSNTIRVPFSPASCPSSAGLCCSGQSRRGGPPPWVPFTYDVSKMSRYFPLSLAAKLSLCYYPPRFHADVIHESPLARRRLLVLDGHGHEAPEGAPPLRDLLHHLNLINELLKIINIATNMYLTNIDTYLPTVAEHAPDIIVEEALCVRVANHGERH